MKKIRIGAGAGYAGDRIQPALGLIQRGRLDYIVFECLAERTIALAQQRKSRNSSEGYDPMLPARMRAVLPLLKQHGTRLISNMGAANPEGAVARICEIAAELNLPGIKIAAIAGDDVLELVRGDLQHIKVIETGLPASSLGDNLISANAYIGALPVVEALQNGADVVIGGRIADPSLFLGPLMHEFGWDADEFGLLGQGILVGHLLECAGQLSGGYFADPPYKQIRDLAHLGFPFADVSADSHAEFSKLESTGGEVNVMTCKEQLLYEIHDPARYLTPDVVADFTQVELKQMGPDRVAADGASGAYRPDSLKVSLGCLEGYIAEAQISYAGPGALDRGKLAIEVVRSQLLQQGCHLDELRCDLIGINSVDARRNSDHEVPEVRVRIAGRTQNMRDAESLVDTAEALYTNGPAAGGGVSKSVRPVIAILSALIPRELVIPRVSYRVTK